MSKSSDKSVPAFVEDHKAFKTMAANRQMSMKDLLHHAIGVLQAEQKG